MKNARLRIMAASMALIFAAPAPMSAFAQEKSVPELVAVTSADKVGEQRIAFDFAGSKPAVKSFSLAAPRRLILDFTGAVNKTNRGAVEMQGVGSQGVELLGDEKRLRAVVNLMEDSVVSEAWEGNKYVLTILRKGAVPAPAASAPAKPADAPAASYANQVQKMDFAKGKTPGSGKLVVDLSGGSVPIDIRTQKNTVTIDFMGTALPVSLAKEFSVADKMSPASSLEWKQLADRARVTIKTQGKWEQSAYQLENRFVFELRQTLAKDKDEQTDPNARYKGDKLTLNFQQIEVRTILQVLADFTGLNIITSDTVGGNITLRLKDVPWDQALDLILQAKNLDQRRQGNVIWIAPQAEIRAKEKADADFKVEVDQNGPMVTENIQLNFATVAKVLPLLTNPQQKILSKRGSAVADIATNQVFIQDIPEKITEAKALLKKLDIPVKQVMIEARIVEASDDFGRSIGARLGYNTTQDAKGNYSVGPSIKQVYNNSNQYGGTAAANTATDSYLVNMPSSGAGGFSPTAIAFSIFNSAKTRFLNMELSALVSDGKGQVLSNPKVVTKNNQKAQIQQGTQIPYQSATSSGATSVSFANATLGLDVTPQITADGHVSMELNVTKNTLGTLTSAGYAIDTKQIQTNVMVEDGGTVVIGGIYTLSENETEARTPLLGELPYIGWLFKNRSTTKSRKEMLVFITPKIIEPQNIGGYEEIAERDTSADIKPVWISNELSQARGNMPPIKFNYEK